MSILRRLIDIARAQADSRPAPGAASPEPAPGQAPDPHAEGAGAAGPAPVQDSRLAAYYANLELPYGAGLDRVRSSWRRLMKQYHPDLHSQDPEKRRVADELTARLTEAYRELEVALGGPRQEAR
ncbi:J domain-containing protein [Candidatus Latescibacterota bacterium]